MNGAHAPAAECLVPPSTVHQVVRGVTPWTRDTPTVPWKLGSLSMSKPATCGSAVSLQSSVKGNVTTLAADGEQRWVAGAPAPHS